MFYVSNPTVKPSSTRWSCSREIVNTATSPTGTEMSYSSCTVQDAGDFCSVVYPLMFCKRFPGLFEKKFFSNALLCKNCNSVWNCRERSLNETSEKARFEAVPPWFLRSDLTTWIRQATKIASPLARFRTEQCVIVIFFFFRQQRFSLNLLNRHYWELFVYSMASPRFLLFALHPVGWRTTHSRWTAADQQSNETITW